jgi:hypothetical protein
LPVYEESTNTSFGVEDEPQANRASRVMATTIAQISFVFTVVPVKVHSALAIITPGNSFVYRQIKVSVAVRGSLWYDFLALLLKHLLVVY